MSPGEQSLELQGQLARTRVLGDNLVCLGRVLRMPDDPIERMRQRLNCVRFITPNGETIISWDSRQLPLELLEAEGCAKEIAAIKAVGTSAPVELEEPLSRDLVASVIIGNEKCGRELTADLVALADPPNSNTSDD